MGRYYNGDINGKFWFGVQSSTAADRFGVSASELNTINYYFDKQDLDCVTKEIKRIKQMLGNDKNKLDEFFKEKDSYNDEELMKALGKDHKKTRLLLSEYADLDLGIKIKECIEKSGDCSFEAEL